MENVLTIGHLNDIFTMKKFRKPRMKIRNILTEKRFTLSFEVFPPVREGNLESLFSTIQELREMKPEFMSVTYGAGGKTRDTSIEIASKVKNEFGMDVLAHLTCVQATKDDIAIILDEFKKEHIENILALRGDPPEGETKFVKTKGGFGYASDLVEYIRTNDDFSIGVAGYPEGHPEAPSLEVDLRNLKRKIDAGADFIITQMFFNNDLFYSFRDRALEMKIRVPIIPGIFPIQNYKQIERIVALSGVKIPSKLGNKLEKSKDKPEDIEKYGIEYATLQAMDLIRNEIRGLHLYCMNRSRPVKQILKDLTLPR
ncbi:MAG: methylenetetrahydrofolate reductase [NAD(P)H] [Deltaproteobacteria bacterium]|nr:methylenetetrahydrofolate reductase [NAD(P)H] [Deltaproteobacteria bacterium]